MKALDTNVLVRFLVADDAQQSKKVQSLLEAAEARGLKYYVSHVVLLETLWVLTSAYRYSRKEILAAVEAMIQMPVLEFEGADVLHKLIAQGKSGTTELADLLIGLISLDHGCDSTLTFDRAAAKSPLFEMLSH